MSVHPPIPCPDCSPGRLTLELLVFRCNHCGRTFSYPYGMGRVEWDRLWKRWTRGMAVVPLPVLSEVNAERDRQEDKWCQQNHPDRFRIGTDHDAVDLRTYLEGADYWKALNVVRVEQRNNEGLPSDRNAAWDGILLEEVFEALAEADPVELRAELIQVAAVAVAWIQAIDRRQLAAADRAEQLAAEANAEAVNQP